jgi:hypothetical protein
MVTDAIGDEVRLRGVLQQIPDENLEDVLDRLVAHLGDVLPDDIRSTVIALLEIFPRLRVEPQGFFDPGADYAVLRPVLKLMQQIRDEEAADRISRNIYETVKSFYARHRFLSLVGERERDQSRIISQSLEAELRTRLRSEIVSAPVSAIEHERELLRTVVQVVPRDDTDIDVLLIERADDPQVTAQLLSTGLNTARQQTLGSVQVRREDRLAWDALVSVFGTEDRLREAVRRMRDSISPEAIESDDRLSRALVLFDRYSSGWRPEEF